MGLVHIACARRGMRTANIAREFGNIGRNEVQCRAIETALRLALRVAAAGPPQVASSRTQCAGSTDK